MQGFTNFAKSKGSDGGAAAAQFLDSKGGQEGFTQSMTNSYNKSGLTGLIEKGKEAATDFQKQSGQDQGAPPSVSALLKQTQSATGQGNIPGPKDLSAVLQQAQAATGQVPELMKQVPGGEDALKQIQSATGIQPVPPAPVAPAAPPAHVGPVAPPKADKAKEEADKTQELKAAAASAESAKATAEAEAARAIAEAAQAKASQAKSAASEAEKDTKIKELEASLKDETAKTAEALAASEEAKKTPLPTDGLKKKINDEYFNNLHLFFGKKHLVTLCETIDPFLKLEEHRDVVVLPTDLEKQNKITEILLALVRNMIFNFSRGEIITGGGTLDQLKKTIKKRISDIKPKFIS